MIEHYQVRHALDAAFAGHGRAVRKADDPPLPGEPYMSMGDAIDKGSAAVMRLLKEKEPKMERIPLTIATVGLLAAVVTGILFFMGLPIFHPDTLAWMFVGWLVSAAVAIGSLILKQVWGETQ